MKKIGFVVCLCWILISSVKATDPSLIRIGGKTIPLSEFKWYLRQSDKFNQQGESVHFQHFLNFQLKVADAHERKLDTLPDFRRQCEFLQARVLKEYFTDHQLADSYYRRWLSQQTGRLQVRDWVKIDILTYRLSQHPSMKEEGNAVRVMDELYERLKKTHIPVESDLEWAEANAVAYENRADRWIPVNSLLNEMIERQAVLKQGEYSLPFYSPKGIHIIRLVDRKNTADEAVVLSQFEKYMERQGSASPVVKMDAFNLWKTGKQKLPADVQLQMKQVHDGLLAAYWDKYSLTVKHAAPTSRELEHFFQANKSDYRWEYPHFKGAVIHCKNKKAASKIKKQLKKLPMALWQEALERMERADSKYKSELECGLYQIGKNAYVDRLAFKCGAYEPLKELPYTFLLGKTLKKGPETYFDVLPQVVSDYQIKHENDRFSDLFSRFKVEINEDVLKTVNSCGNK